MSLVHKAASISPPVQGKNLWAVAGSTSSQAIKVPESWLRNLVTLEADGADFYISFSTDSSAAVSETATSTIASGEFTALGATVATKIADGSDKAFDLSQIPLDRGVAGRSLYLVVKASAAAGYLRIHRSSGNVAV
jgi:hypothetical protein